MIKDGRLSRSDADDRTIGNDSSFVVIKYGDPARRRHLPIPNFHLTLKLSARVINKETQTVDTNGTGGKIFSLTKHYLFRPGIDAQDKSRFAESDSESFSLADGEFFVAGMLPENVTLKVNEIAFRSFVASILFQEPGVVVARHEADFIAILLLSDTQARFFCECPDRRFFVVSDRQKNSLE